MDHTIASREDWLDARKALLAKERAITHQLDALRAERRELPWVRVDKPYRFEGPDGEVSLAELFGARSQLAVYHFMLAPGSDHVCAGCSFTVDHVDAARQHFEQADLAFAADGSLYVLEHASGIPGVPFPFAGPGSLRKVPPGGGATSTLVAGGLPRA